MWIVEDKTSHVLIKMTSNAVNKMDRSFLMDLHATFDSLEENKNHKPLVLSSASHAAFSVGLDFNYCFEIFGRQNETEIADWFDFFRSALIRVYAYPAKTIAAIDGHTFAGGLILALACDYRIAADRKCRFALNEVPIGIPMPAVYCEMIRRKVGDPVAFDTILTGRHFDVHEALRLGFVHELVSREKLLKACNREAEKLTPAAWSVYAHTKQLLLSESIEYIKTQAVALDRESVTVIGSPSANAAQRAALDKLKRSQRMNRG